MQRSKTGGYGAAVEGLCNGDVPVKDTPHSHNRFVFADV